MARPGEERRFAVLLEQVGSEVRTIAEGLVSLDQRVDRGFTDVRQEMANGFQDLRAGLAEVARRLQEHERTRHGT